MIYKNIIYNKYKLTKHTVLDKYYKYYMNIIINKLF